MGNFFHFGGAGNSGGEPSATYETVIEEITTSGTWTVPEGVTEVDVFLVDGGQAGSNGSAGAGTPNYTGGAGGKGGNGGRTMYIPGIGVTPLEEVSVVVGAGGVSNGAAGGVTSFKDFSTSSDFFYARPAAKGGEGGAQVGRNVTGKPGTVGAVGVRCLINGVGYGFSGSGGGSGGGGGSSNTTYNQGGSGASGVTAPYGTGCRGGNGGAGYSNGYGGTGTAGASAAPNTGNGGGGGGGGGGYYDRNIGSAPSAGGAGGSGIIVLRYQKPVS